MTRTTARSRSGAVPITVPFSGFVWTPSLKETVIPVVPSTTWLFVRISPSRRRITPDASPLPPPNDDVWTLTTEGRTRVTAAASEPARSGAAAVSVGVDSRTVTVCVAVVAGVDSSSPPPLQPASSAAAASGASHLTAASGT